MTSSLNTAFYAAPRGTVVAGLIAEQLRALWPEADLRGQDLLGLGHAMPYLPYWQGAARCVAATLDEREHWIEGGRNRACLVQEESLPFADMSFDRILLVHGLEGAQNARRMLREVWRVLRENGRLIVVAPNRHGVWAHMESTPLGQGQPFSPGQIDRLLTGTMFRVQRRQTALYLPPTRLPAILRAARLIERTGARLAPGMGGVLITEAVKDVYAAIPLRRVPARRRIVLAEAA
jgi:SAM-dependent methyltransferase